MEAIFIFGFCSLLGFIFLAIAYASKFCLFGFLSLLSFLCPFMFYTLLIPYWEGNLEQQTLGCYETKSDYYDRYLHLKKTGIYYLREAELTFEGNWDIKHLDGWSQLQLNKSSGYFFIYQNGKNHIHLQHSENSDLRFYPCPCKN